MTKKPFTYEEFKSIYSKVPRLTVDAIIRKGDGIVLSLRREGMGWANEWHLPGGTILYKESIEESLHRIVKDETGLDVEIVKFLGYMEYPDEERERGFGYSVSLTLLCEYISGELQPNEDALDVRVFVELPENTIKIQEEFLKNHWEEIFQNNIV